jgi:hypothetical protein
MPKDPDTVDNSEIAINDLPINTDKVKNLLIGHCNSHIKVEVKERANSEVR